MTPPECMKTYNRSIQRWEPVVQLSFSFNISGGWIPPQMRSVKPCEPPTKSY